MFIGTGLLYDLSQTGAYTNSSAIPARQLKSKEKIMPRGGIRGGGINLRARLQYGKLNRDCRSMR